MKGLWKEFKAFIFRGNVVDMAIGVIVASAFTAIVNGLSTYVLKPLVDWVLTSLIGADSLTGVFTMLKGEYVDVLDDTGAVIGKTPDPTAIYIDWGEFVSTIINFLMIALTLFIILKTFTTIKKRMNIKAGIQAKLDADEELNDIEKRILRKWEKRDPATAPKKAVPAPAAPAAPTEAELLTKLCALMEENIELQKTNKQ